MNHFYETIDGWSQMSEQGQLLETLLKLVDVNEKIKILEIGVYQGRMTAMWNSILISRDVLYEYIAVDHFRGSEEHSKEINYYDQTLKNLEPIMDYITIIKNDSVSESEKHPDEWFDIIYLDASHDYESVMNDIKCWYPKVKPGGFLCGDDYVRGWPGVVKAVDEQFHNIIKHGKQQWYYPKNENI